MKFTQRDIQSITTRKTKTSGHYGFADEGSRKAYCKCPPNYRIGDWPNNCLSCSRRIPI